MMFQQSLAILTGLCAMSTAAVLPQANANGTGPKGFLTVDNSVPSTAQHGIMAVAGADYMCLADTTATVPDCRAVINDIRANDQIEVAAGFCLNWYEGGCLGRICGGTEGPATFSGGASGIADQMTSWILEPCISQGKSGAFADCHDVGGTCGSYHFSLQTYAGGM